MAQKERIKRHAGKATRGLAAWAWLLQPYWLVNCLLIFAYIPVRLHFAWHALSAPEAASGDPGDGTAAGPARRRWGGVAAEELPRWEVQVVGMVLLICVVKILRPGVIPRALAADMLMYGKAAALTLIWLADPRLGVWHALACIAAWLTTAMPPYAGEHHWQEVSGPEFRELLATRDGRRWVAQLYSSRSQRCRCLEPLLAQLSLRHTDARFIRLDVAAWPAIAEQQGVSLIAAREQLPTLLAFKNGAEAARLPHVDQDSGVVRRASFVPAKVAATLGL